MTSTTATPATASTQTLSASAAKQTPPPVKLSSLLPLCDSIADRTKARPDGIMLVTADKVTPTVARMLCEALPDVDAMKLRKGDVTTEIACAIYCALAAHGVYRSLRNLPHCTIIEAQALAKAGTIKTYQPLPDGTAICCSATQQIRAGGKSLQASNGLTAHDMLLQQTSAQRRALYLLALTTKPAKAVHIAAPSVTPDDMMAQALADAGAPADAVAIASAPTAPTDSATDAQPVDLSLAPAQAAAAKRKAQHPKPPVKVVQPKPQAVPSKAKSKPSNNKAKK